GSETEPPGGDLGREMDEARPPHLVALLDRDRVGAVAQAASEHAGKGGGGRAGRGIFRDAHAGGEHAGMKMVTGLGGLVAEHVDRRTGAEGGVELGEIGAAARDRSQGDDGHEGQGNAGRPSPMSSGTSESAAAMAATSAVGPTSVGNCGMVKRALPPPPRIDSSVHRTAPMPSSSTRSRPPSRAPSSTAVPTVGWPANG